MSNDLTSPSWLLCKQESTWVAPDHDRRNTAQDCEVTLCMKLLTQKILQQLPALYATENQKDPMVICKFFYVDFPWTWYAIEFDGEDIFYGFVDGDFPELGYFSLSELTAVRGKLGLPIERDLDFQPCRLSQLRAELER